MEDQVPQRVLRLEVRGANAEVIHAVEIDFDGTLDGLRACDIEIALKTLADNAFREEADRRFAARVAEFQMVAAAHS